MFKTRYLVLTGMILIAAISRLLPHPPNFAPITAIALFGGAHFYQKRFAFLVPIAALFLSDLILGFHQLMLFTYGCFVIIIFLGLWLQKRRTVSTIVVTSLMSSILFFMVTNFGVWMLSGMYTYDQNGLMTCYIAALPFFQNTLVGDLVYTGILFGGFALAQRRFTSLRLLANFPNRKNLILE